MLLCLVLTTTNCFAVEIFVNALYWRASETADWCFSNNLSSSNQVSTYRTASFDYAPGFKVGVGYKKDWETQLYYTRFYTNDTDSAQGNLTSAFAGGKLIQASNGNFLYNSGQLSFSINYNVLDWDLSKSFHASKAIILRPIIGLRGAWINQTINTSFQGLISISEKVKNDFSGVGPKAGIESKWILKDSDKYQFSIFANFTTSYLWGKWKISDVLNATSGATMHTIVGTRNFGAFAAQALMGLNFDYDNFTMNFGYELIDWFNQYQVFDDDTGGHNNDLILQGLNLGMIYRF